MTTLVFMWISWDNRQRGIPEPEVWKAIMIIFACDGITVGLAFLLQWLLKQ